MAITMQGSWTLRVTVRNAACAQRFIVSGAHTGNGVYDGVPGKTVFVTGAQWSISVQYRPSGQSWRDSTQRLGLPNVNGGLLRLDVSSNDGGLDDECDALVIACSLPASRSDYIVYGTVKAYAGPCLFNPQRDDYIVIDPPFELSAVCARHPQLSSVIQKLYPERARAEDAADPYPMPHDMAPLIIPTGLPNVAVGLVFQSRLSRAPEIQVDEREEQHSRWPEMKAALLDAQEADAVNALQTRVRRVPFKGSPLKAGTDRLSRAELKAISDIRDAAVRFRCELDRAPGLLLRFQRYARTATELRDGPYTGRGVREDLGVAATDEQGNYVFRFSHAPDDCAAIAEGDEVLQTALRPDVIVQVLGAEQVVNFEAAPYDNIANLRRIDLCVPHAQARPRRARLNRDIQRPGDLRMRRFAVESVSKPYGAESRSATAMSSARWEDSVSLSYSAA